MITYEPAFRVLLVTSLLVLVGVPPTLLTSVFPVLRNRGVERARAHRLALLVVGPALAVAIASATVLTVLKFSSLSAITHAGDPAFLETELAHVWLAQMGLGFGLLGLTVGVAADRLPVSRRQWLGTVTAGAMAMLAVFCWTRYSTAVSSRELAVGVKWFHMTGAAIWFGGLLVMAKLPSLLPRETDVALRGVVAAFIRRFSILAVAGVTIAFVTGILITSWHVPSVAALVTTSYGIVILAKLVLVMGAAGLGGFNRLVLHGQIHETGESSGKSLPGMFVIDKRLQTRNAVKAFVTAVRLELAVLVLAILTSVMLTAVLPPSYTVIARGVEQTVTMAVGTAGSAAGDLLLVPRAAVPMRTWFAEALQLASIVIAISGALVLGYELGEFEPNER